MMNYRITLLLLCFLGPALPAAEKAVPVREPLVIQSADGSRHTLQVEVVDTAETRARGLMFRTRLPASSGMLFDYGKSDRVAMWMKNTPLSLDMVFIRDTGEISKIHNNAVPHSLQRINSGEPVRASLEVNAGTLEKLGIREGDFILHPIFSAEIKP